MTNTTNVDPLPDCLAPTILVMGGGTRLPGALHRNGVRVIFAGTPDEFTPAHQEICSEAWLMDTLEEEIWIRRATLLHREFPFQLAVSLRERFLTCAAKINDALGLGGNPLATVLALKDKASMRELLAADVASPGTAVRAKLLTTPEDLTTFIADVGLPIILKPRDGTGSEGVSVLRDPDDLGSACHQIESGPGALLAEEFLVGPEFSVETLSHGGRHQVLAVTEKFIGEGLVEAGHLIPARLSDPVRAGLSMATREFLDTIGLIDGPAHTELILTVQGPRIVESHNRNGGDGITDLVRHAYGADPRDSFAAQLAHGVAPEVMEASAAAAVWFLTAAPGLVTEMTGWDHAASAAGVVALAPQVAVGDTVNSLAGSDDRCGWVMAVGTSGDEALARARNASALIEIYTDPTGT
jgi:biotin carboxylase